MPTVIDRPMEDTHLRLLRPLEGRPDLSRRDLARELGTSLGKVNYCLNALIDKGLINVRNFRNNRNKLSYVFPSKLYGILAAGRPPRTSFRAAAFPRPAPTAQSHPGWCRAAASRRRL
jgi:predicted ArsR family transcriptional regulator